ncbi:hypothetical protein F4803DRAFT_499485 [Xylaria telfairii]|nr:hypothetical protein F4803DRAFT_499485 [Xylaria telfairii]
MAETTGTTATSYSTDPALYIYTSLTAGSSNIVTATSRLETILRANRVPFKALDIATDEKARMLWGRRAGKDANGRARKLPSLVQMGLVLGDIVEIEEWNEYGELKDHVAIYYDDFTIPPKNQAPPPVAMRPLNQPFPTSGIAPSSSKAAAPATPPATTTSAPAPPAPPLPTDKDKAKIPLSSPGSTGTAKNVANTGASAKAAVPNIAEEAAKKAKQVQLDRLREKVHGKKAASPSSTPEAKAKENKKPDVTSQKTSTKVASTATGKAKENKKPDATSQTTSKKVASTATSKAKEHKKPDVTGQKTSKKVASTATSKPKDIKKPDVTGQKTSKKAISTVTSKAKENKKPDGTSQITSKKATSAATDSVSASISNMKLAGDKSAVAGLQSPTTGKWRSGTTPDSSAQALLQSPTTGTWKADASRGIGATITQHRGAVVASASKEEIAAIEKAEAIPEVNSSEEEDDEDDEEDEDDDEEEEEDEDEDDDEEEEEDDDDDDEDEDDSDDEDEESEESEDDNAKKGKGKK